MGLVVTHTHSGGWGRSPVCHRVNTMGIILEPFGRSAHCSLTKYMRAAGKLLILLQKLGLNSCLYTVKMLMLAIRFFFCDKS